MTLDEELAGVRPIYLERAARKLAQAEFELEEAEEFIREGPADYDKADEIERLKHEARSLRARVVAEGKRENFDESRASSDALRAHVAMIRGNLEIGQRRWDVWGPKLLELVESNLAGRR